MLRFLAVPIVFGSVALAQQAIWLQRPVAPLTPRVDAEMAYDSSRHVTVLFGGRNQSDTWRYSGSGWTQVTGAGGPPAAPTVRDTLGMTYDSNRQRVVLTSSMSPAGLLETWEYVANQWVLVNTNAALSNRIDYSLAYDSVRSVVVLFGGTLPNGPQEGLAETWIWDGTSWNQAGGTAPPPRHRASMAFDAARQVMVMFGGASREAGNYITRGDTWEWNGVAWSRRQSASGPSTRAGAQLAYDSRRGRLVLFGGDGGIGIGALGDTWEWDGVTWHPTTPNGFPPAFVAAPFVYDDARGVAVAYLAWQTSDVWEYVPGNRASFVTYGSGCAGPAGVPNLQAVAGSRPVLGQQFHVQLSGLPQSQYNPAFGLIGFEARSWNGNPLPASLDAFGLVGCKAWIAPAITVPCVNQNGVAPWNSDIPLDLDLLGVGLFMQGAVLVPGWNPASFVLSNAGDGLIGW